MKEKLIKLIRKSKNEAFLTLLTHFFETCEKQDYSHLQEENELLRKENMYFKKYIFGDTNYPTTQCSQGCGAIVSDIPFETHDGMCDECSTEYIKSFSV